MMRKMLHMFLAFAASGAFAAGGDTVLGGFKPGKEIDAWLVRGGTELKVANWPDFTPGNCGKLTFKKYAGGGEKWPAIIMNMAPPMSWRLYEKLVFNAYAAEETEFSLCFVSAGATEAADRYSGHAVTLKKGMNRVEVVLSRIAGVNLDDLKQFHLLKTTPAQDTVIYVGEIQLLPCDLGDIARQVQESRDKIEAVRAAKLSPEQGKYIAKALDAAVATAAKLKATPVAKIAAADLKRLRQQQGALERSYQQALLTMIPDAGAMSAYWASPLEKVHRVDQCFINMPKAVGLFDAARGEGEGLQLAVFPRRDIDSVTVGIHETPRLEDGTELSKWSFKIAPVGYVDCPPPCYSVERSGLWPDPILTYAGPICLTKDCWQSWWVELTVPENQKPGLYIGSVVVRGEGLKPLTAKFQVRVRNFTLRPGPPYPNTAPVMPDTRSFEARDASPEEILRWRHEVFDLLLSHRGNPDSLYIGGNSPPAPLESAKYRIDRNAGLFNITTLHTTAPMDRIDAMMPLYRQAGLDKNAYFYGFDEFSAPEFWRIKQACKPVKEKYPEIPIFCTAYDYSLGTDSNNLNQYIDGWIPLTAEFINNIKTVRDVQRLGKKVWWYVCCGPGKPWANFFVENPALDSRLLMGAMFWKYRPDGMLYFSADSWGEPDQKEQWDLRPETRKHAISGAPITNWSAQTTMKKWNGDGLLIYPGENGPIPSLRLKAYRDGMDDYIYLKMLSEALKQVRSGKAKMPDGWSAKARAELRIEPELVESMTMFAADPELLFAKRARLAELLESYHDAGNAPVTTPDYNIKTPLWEGFEALVGPAPDGK